MVRWTFVSGQKFETSEYRIPFIIITITIVAIVAIVVAIAIAIALFQLISISVSIAICKKMHNKMHWQWSNGSNGKNIRTKSGLDRRKS